MGTADWVNQLFAAIDRKDSNEFASFLTDDASFQFGNAEPVRGKGAIGQAVAGFLDSIRALRHEVLESWQHADAVICRGQVTYTRHDGSQLTVPFADILRMRGGLVCDYLIYLDASRLYAP
jgi:ketosteroid isomerase-like protein